MTKFTLWLPFYFQAESLVKAQQDIGETMGQLGLAFVKLTKFETEEVVHNSQRTRAADMKNVATAAVKASRLYRELNAQTVKHLVSIFPCNLELRNGLLCTIPCVILLVLVKN